MRMARLKLDTGDVLNIPPNMAVIIHTNGITKCWEIGQQDDTAFWTLDMTEQEAVAELNAAMNWEYPGHRSDYMQLSKDHDGHASVSCGSCGQNIDTE